MMGERERGSGLCAARAVAGSASGTSTDALWTEETGYGGLVVHVDVNRATCRV